MTGKVGGPGGSDFGLLPTSSSLAKARSPTVKAMTVVWENMRGGLSLDQEVDGEVVGLERGAASCRLYRASRRHGYHMLDRG
jgi:hypothetical protein